MGYPSMSQLAIGCQPAYRSTVNFYIIFWIKMSENSKKVFWPAFVCASTQKLVKMQNNYGSKLTITINYLKGPKWICQVLFVHSLKFNVSGRANCVHPFVSISQKCPLKTCPANGWDIDYNEHSSGHSGGGHFNSSFFACKCNSQRT